jgi:hypothetical protein
VTVSREDLTAVARHLDAFAVGREKAMRVPVLARALGLTPRHTQAVIRELALRHYPMGSTCGKPPGVYRIATEEEWEETIRQQEARRDHESHRLAALKRARQYLASPRLLEI